MANTLGSLLGNHYLFYEENVHYETPRELIDHVSRKKLTFVFGVHLFQYPSGKESATFIGYIKDVSEELLYRIYDRKKGVSGSIQFCSLDAIYE